MFLHIQMTSVSVWTISTFSFICDGDMLQH